MDKLEHSIQQDTRIKTHDANIEINSDVLSELHNYLLSKADIDYANHLITDDDAIATYYLKKSTTGLLPNTNLQMIFNGNPYMLLEYLNFRSYYGHHATSIDFEICPYNRNTRRITFCEFDVNPNISYIYQMQNARQSKHEHYNYSFLYKNNNTVLLFTACQTSSTY